LWLAVTFADMEPTTFTVRSADRTRIACHVSGAGPCVLLIPGATMDAGSWGPVRGVLERQATVYAIDRRGTGGSGSTPGADVTREVEDVLAILGTVGKPVALVGQSSGAVLALHVLRSHPAPAALLYEPPHLGTAPHAVPDLPERVAAALAAGDQAGAVALFLRHGPGLPDETIAGLRRTPAWPRLLATAGALPADAALIQGVTGGDLDLGGIDTPIRLMVGGSSPDWMRAGVTAIADALPDATVAVLPDEGHDAFRTAPKRLAAEIAAFCVRTVPL
jgi:pimeloyl-ACP methyl ester carboxylesterase